MLRSFMIEFRFDEEIHFAHVSEYKDSPFTYFVSLISLHNHPTRKLILKESEGKISLAEGSQPASNELVELIALKIQEEIRRT